MKTNAGCASVFSSSTISLICELKQPYGSLYINHTLPWLQKHNAAAPRTQHRRKYHLNWNVYSVTLMIIVFVFPSQVFPLVFPSVDLLQFLNYSMSIYWSLLHSAFCCSQPTYTHSRACCDVPLKLHHLSFTLAELESLKEKREWIKK